MPSMNPGKLEKHLSSSFDSCVLNNPMPNHRFYHGWKQGKKAVTGKVTSEAVVIRALICLQIQSSDLSSRTSCLHFNATPISLLNLDSLKGWSLVQDHFPLAFWEQLIGRLQQVCHTIPSCSSLASGICIQKQLKTVSQCISSLLCHIKQMQTAI